MRFTYTMFTVDALALTNREADHSDYNLQKESALSNLNDLGKLGWRVVGQSILPGPRPRILFTLMKEQS